MRVGARLLAVLSLAACSSSASTTGTRPEQAGSPEAACESTGEPKACAEAAELYFDGGSGLPAHRRPPGSHPLDHAKSFRYSSTACDKGHAFACALVGFHQQDGLGTAWAPDKAVASYEKACAGGAGVGCYNLATMYSGGHGVLADQAKTEAYKVKARAVWQAACDGPEPRWCTNVAYLLREEDPKGNRARALTLDQRSCDAKVLVGCTEAARDRLALGQITGAAMVGELDTLCRDGEPTACMTAGSLLVTGSEGVTADPTRGMALVVRGCEIGDKQACAAAGIEYATGRLVAEDDAAAARYLNTACDRGLGAACMWIARERVSRGEPAAAAPFAQRACQMGEREACAALASLYLEGRGVAKDEAAGERWSMESCRMGYPPGCGVLIERDRELPVPSDLAARIYAEACDGGIQKACQRAAPAAGSAAD